MIFCPAREFELRLYEVPKPFQGLKTYALVPDSEQVHEPSLDLVNIDRTALLIDGEIFIHAW